MCRLRGSVNGYGATARRPNRPYGTAAQYTALPIGQVFALAANVSLKVGACLGIPGITAYRAVQAAGDLPGKTVLVQGAAGAVRTCAVQLAHRAGARVIATCSTKPAMGAAIGNGADHVLLIDDALARSVHAIAPQGMHHIVEVAFGEDIALDLDLFAVGGSISAYASHASTPQIPFWELLFKNVSIHLVGSDDVPPDSKIATTIALNEALTAGSQGPRIAERFTLEQIALARQCMKCGMAQGRVVLTM